MKTSESIKSIAPALLKAQKEMEGAKKGASNPFFKSKYSDFNSVLEACKGPLNDNEISILQPHRVDTTSNGIFMVVETILLHSSGEFISGETKVEVAKANDPQALGSAQTYAKRYGLQSIVALPSEDDDGEAAVRGTTSNKPVAAPTKISAPVKIETKVAAPAAANTVTGAFKKPGSTAPVTNGVAKPNGTAKNVVTESEWS